MLAIFLEIKSSRLSYGARLVDNLLRLDILRNENDLSVRGTDRGREKGTWEEYKQKSVRIRTETKNIIVRDMLASMSIGNSNSGKTVDKYIATNRWVLIDPCSQLEFILSST